MTPDVPSPVWVQVVTRDGRRCTCRGACGHPHDRADRSARCTSSGSSRRLVAAPVDPAVPEGEAGRLPVEALTTWCPGCLDGARRHAAPAVLVDGTGELFASDALTRVIPAARRARSGSRGGRVLS